MEKIKEKLATHKEGLMVRFKVKELGIFGSYVRDEEKEGSDKDILVELALHLKSNFLPIRCNFQILGAKVTLSPKPF
jgi:predicted nucleotidyltransferase